MSVERTQMTEAAFSPSGDVNKLMKNPPKYNPQSHFDCPLCGVRLKPLELESHYQIELAKVCNFKGNIAKKGKSVVNQDGNQLSPFPPVGEKRSKREAAVHARRKVQMQTASIDSSLVRLDESANQTCNSHAILKKIRQNRTERGKYTFSSPQKAEDSVYGLSSVILEETAPPECPVCSQPMYGDDEAVNMHVDNCLQSAQRLETDADGHFSAQKKRKTDKSTHDLRPGNPSTPSHHFSSNDESSFETYTWAGQTRVRATALLEGGFAELGYQTSNRSKREMDESDGELDIDGDEQQAFGEPQYSESDVILCEDDETRQQISGLLSCGGISGRGQILDSSATDCEPLPVLNSDEEFSSSKTSSMSPNRNVIFESLKNRIRELMVEREKLGQQQCLVCMEPYKTPLVSINCWHVHCEACWLATLGAKKLCPQCNIITSPANLRRIYL